MASNNDEKKAMLHVMEFNKNDKVLIGYEDKIFKLDVDNDYNTLVLSEIPTDTVIEKLFNN